MGLIVICFLFSYLWMRLSMLMTYNNLDKHDSYDMKKFRQSRNNIFKLDNTRTTFFFIIGFVVYIISSLIIVECHEETEYADAEVCTYTKSFTEFVIGTETDAWEDVIYTMYIQNGDYKEILVAHEDRVKFLKTSSENPRAVKALIRKSTTEYGGNILLFGRKGDKGEWKIRKGYEGSCNCNSSRKIIIIPENTVFKPIN